MINLAVINLKTIIKKLIKIMIQVICFFIICLMIKKVIGLFHTENYMTSILSSFSFKYNKIIEENIIVFGHMKQNEINKKSNLKKMLISELTIFNAEEEKLMEAENQEEVLEFSNENLYKTEEKARYVLLSVV